MFLEGEEEMPFVKRIFLVDSSLEMVVFLPEIVLCKGARISVKQE